MPTTILDNESYLEALQRRYVEESKNEENMKLIQMAEEACAPNQTFNSDEEWVKRFAAIVASRERSIISETFWAAVNDCITTDELGVEFMSKFYQVHEFGHWLDGKNK